MNQVYRHGVSNSKTGSVRGIGGQGVGFEAGGRDFFRFICIFEKKAVTLRRVSIRLQNLAYARNASLFW